MTRIERLMFDWPEEKPKSQPSLKELLNEDLPERSYLNYKLTVTNQAGTVVREMELLRPQEGEPKVEKTETLAALLAMLHKVKDEPLLRKPSEPIWLNLPQYG